MAIKNETNIDNFKINYLSEELYQEAVRNGEINPNELYMTPITSTTTNVEWDDILNKPATFNPSSHMHYKSQISDFPSSMPASDVYSWAKASSKPSYTKSEIGLGNVDNTSDKDKSVKYATSAGSAQSVNWLNISEKPSTFTPSSHSHSEYASSNHSHSGYAATNHTHNGYASSSHSHSEYLNSSFSGYNSNDLTNPSYFAVWGSNQIRTLTTSNVCNVIGAAKSSHTHSEYSPTGHTHSEYALSSHSHSGYASSNHKHSEYASAYHSHSDYAQSVHNHVQLGYYEPSYQNDGDLWFKEV